jgi:hypothetical protein
METNQEFKDRIDKAIKEAKKLVESIDKTLGNNKGKK